MLELDRSRRAAELHRKWAEQRELTRKAYLSLPVRSRFPLWHLLELIQKQDPTIRPKSEDWWHLSLFDFGNLERFHGAASKVIPGLPVNVSRQVFETIYERCERGVEGIYKVWGDSLDIYGFFGQTIGLKVEADDALLDVRERVFEDINGFLKMWNMPDIQEIMAPDPQLAMFLSGRFEPHISIATVKRPDELPPLDQFDVENLELQLGAGHF